MDKSKKTSEKYNRGSTNGEPDYTRDLPTWRLEALKWGMGNKNNNVKFYWCYKEYCAGKGRLTCHKTEDYGMWSITL